MLALALLAAVGAWHHDTNAAPVSPAPVACADGTIATPTVAPLEMFAPDDPDADLSFTRSTPVRVTVALPAGAACPGLKAHVEVVVPTGARLADWHEPQTRCDGATCRVAYRTGTHGGLIVDGPWPLESAGASLALEVPVAYYAPLGPPRQVKVLVTFVGVEGESAPVTASVLMVEGGEGEDAGDPLDDDPRPSYDQGAPLPAKLSRKDVADGIRFNVEGTAGTKATIKLSTKSGTTIASATRTAKGRGTMHLVLKADRRVKRPTAATLTITRTGGAYAALSLAQALKIT